ncbi:unnamed protein product [Moneuplotes crassus]|uniref:SWIM-type domain-containing protein n=1 Tax=Euplotes crassus TaxID=5936 RepID=A0AAD1Y4T2_EUPCR|nr:unnamed protein product [Moneuplotes crassus]
MEQADPSLNTDLVSINTQNTLNSEEKEDYNILQTQKTEEDLWNKKELHPDLSQDGLNNDDLIHLVETEAEGDTLTSDSSHVYIDIPSSQEDTFECEQDDDESKTVDYTSYPSYGESQEEILERYNEIGIHDNLLFKARVPKGTMNCFELICITDDCPVALQFDYDEEKKLYSRDPCFETTHNHFLNVPEVRELEEDIISDLRDAYFHDPCVNTHDFAAKISEIAKVEVEPYESLMILLSIKKEFRVDLAMLALDLKNIQQAQDNIHIILNKGDLTVMFVQTEGMKQHLIHNPYSILVSVSSDKQNKYGFHVITFTSITIFGQAVTCGLGFINIKSDDTFGWVFSKFLDRAGQLLKGKYPPIFIIPFEAEVIAAGWNTLGQVSRMYCSQYSMINAVRDILRDYLDDDEEDAKLVFTLSLKIITETSLKKWEKLEEKIIEKLGFCKYVYRWYDKFFFDQKNLWRMTTKDKMFYTGGLHTNYRGQDMHKYLFKKLTCASGLFEIIKLVEKIQYYDFSLKILDREISMIKSHPVKVAIKRSFTPYSVSFMIKEMLKSFDHTVEIIEEETKYKIKEHNSIGGRSFKVKKTRSKQKAGNFRNFEISCNCPFFQTHLMICRHIFKIFSVLQLKTVQYFDYIPHWREDASLKKFKVKVDKKRFCAGVVTFKHEKRLRSFMEFIGDKCKKGGSVSKTGKNKGTRVGGGFDKRTVKEMKARYMENKERIRQEFGDRKKIEMYYEQAKKDKAKKKDVFDMTEIEKKPKQKFKKEPKKAKNQGSSSSCSDEASSSSAAGSDSESESESDSDSSASGSSSAEVDEDGEIKSKIHEKLEQTSGKKREIKEQSKAAEEEIVIL